MEVSDGVTKLTTNNSKNTLQLNCETAKKVDGVGSNAEIDKNNKAIFASDNFINYDKTPENRGKNNTRALSAASFGNSLFDEQGSDLQLISETRDGSISSSGKTVNNFRGPGPSLKFSYSHVFRCFDRGNGLLFRLVDKKRHVWAFYNDTTTYTMYISVVFGKESAVVALGQAAYEAAAAAGAEVEKEAERICITLVLPPGQTGLFMRGEYNGFKAHYSCFPVTGMPAKTDQYV